MTRLTLTSPRFTSAQASARPLEVPPHLPGTLYTVGRGDRYSRIVKHHDAYEDITPPVSYREIFRYNREILGSNITNPNTLMAGDQIFLPSREELAAFRRGERSPVDAGLGNAGSVNTEPAGAGPVAAAAEAEAAAAPNEVEDTSTGAAAREGATRSANTGPPTMTSATDAAEAAHEAHHRRNSSLAVGTGEAPIPTTGDLVLAPPGTHGGPRLTNPNTPRTDGERGPNDLFDYVDTVRPPETPNRPGMVGGILRGTEWQPVFGRGDNWFTQGLSDAGNGIMDAIGDGLSGLVHQTHGVSTDIPITDELVLGFSASGRKLREDEIPPGDPRRLGIEELRAQHPGALPMWLEGNFGQHLAFNLGHQVALGPSGAYLTFGISAGESMEFSMQRLAYLPSIGDNIHEGDSNQLARLARTPLSASDVAAMETGATYRFTGNAHFRVDAALGLGVAVPALSNVMRIGAGVEVGAYASLAGNFTVQMQRVERGRARITFTSNGTAETGAQLRLWAGVEINYTELSRFLRNFADYVIRGGDPRAFQQNLTSERERAIAESMGDYMRVFARNLAEGTGVAVVEDLVHRYAVSYLEARGGLSIASNFSTSFDFELTSTQTVILPRADMVPESMRNGTAGDQPVTVQVGELARLAYNMAIRGDLRLVQQLSLIRNSGVRINERVQTDTTGTSHEVGFKLPFLEYRRTGQSTSTVIDRYVPELGRTRTAIESFNQTYRGIFGDTEDASAQVRVHSPHGERDSQVFFGSDQNFSTDFVVQNLRENWTNYEEMQNLVGVLNAISGGRLEARAREALGEGAYRNDTAADDWNPIHQLFFKPREFGRTIAHLHIWIGEPGLRQLLDGELSEEQLYQVIGQVFADLHPDGSTVMPAWARPNADRMLPGERVGEYARRFYSDRVITYEDDDSELGQARYLVDNLMRLSRMMREARTPRQEEQVAIHIRDFLRDAENKLSAYAALATLVPEDQRAVEMRLTSLRRDEAPIRFTYIQDGRNSEILYATGFARVAMQQYQRYLGVLDVETRLRVGGLLGEVHAVLNSPSPDLYRLRRAMHALQIELRYMDERAVEMGDIITRDLGIGRAFLDTLPSATTIQAVLPNALGTELTTLRLNALRLLNSPHPDLLLLRSTFQNIMARMDIYRRIASVAEVVEGTAHLANELAESHENLAEEAVKAVNALRKAITDGDSDEKLQEKLDAVTGIHTRLMEAAADAAGTTSAITADAEEPPAPARAAPVGGAAPASVDEMREDREASGERFRTLAGNPQVAPLSYFERTGVVPAHYMGTPYESGGDGVVTGSMLREAELAMAANRPSGNLRVPALAAERVEELLTLARGDDPVAFLDRAEALAFQPAVVVPDPGREVLEYMLVEIPVEQRREFLSHFSGPRQTRLERIFAELDTVQNREERRTDRWRRERDLFFRENPRYEDDRNFLLRTWREDARNLEAVVNTLGYGRTIDNWHVVTTARLEGVLSQLTGDELNNLVSPMSREQAQRFYHLIRNSDLTPQTRAKLAGDIVDNHLFWRQQEELVEALVTGLSASDMRIFFDQLWMDGKLEDFLQPSSIWRTLLIIFTFGLAMLFLHDNEAALRVVAAHGWNADELAAEYNPRYRFLSSVERDAERILFHATLDTIPMDPGIRGGLRVVHTMLGNVKYYHFEDLPAEAGRLLLAMGEGAGRQLVTRLGDIAEQGGSPGEIIEEYRQFFAGLSPDAIAQQMNTPDTDGTVAIIAKALADGAVAGLIRAAHDPRNRFITLAVLNEIMVANNQLDSPIYIGESEDARIDAATNQGLREKAAFYSQYTGFDFSQIRIIVGGFSPGAQMTLADTISIPRDNFTENADGTLSLSDTRQQVTAFHECSHTLQQIIYGASVNAFIDQGLHLGAGHDRARAYTVTQDQFDSMTSIHDLREHWEQQAELLEQSMRLLWARSQATGSSNPAVYEAYTPGQSLHVSGATITLTPERWQKMVQFVHEWGASAQRALGRTGGRFVNTPIHDPV